MTAKKVWKVEDLLDIIKSEIEAREISEAIRATDLKVVRSSQKASVNSLCFTKNQSQLYCAYCKGEYFSTLCEVVKNVTARTDSLKKEGHCFLCLSKGHRVIQGTV